jgi:hypothetical protein
MIGPKQTGYVVKVLYDDNAIASRWVLAKHGHGRVGALVSGTDATVFANSDEAEAEATIWRLLPNARFSVVVEPA